MKIYKKNDRLTNSQEGIWLDFRNNTFLFFVEDTVYSDRDVLRSARKELQLSFVQKGILDLFLLEIDDCLECSDIPFCMKEADDTLLDALKGNEELSWQVVLCDETGLVQAERDGVFSEENSSLLRKKLLNRMEEEYSVEDFEKAYEKNCERYEPYDLISFAVFTQKEKKK